MSQVSFDFNRYKFVVTGASSGVGKQIACELAEAGAVVLAMARRESELNALKEQYPNNIVVAAVDGCDYPAVEASVKDFVSQFALVDMMNANQDKNINKVMSIDFGVGLSWGGCMIDLSMGR